MNPGEFDGARFYYRRQRVLASVRVNRACDVQVMHTGVTPTLAEAKVGVSRMVCAGILEGASGRSRAASGAIARGSRSGTARRRTRLPENRDQPPALQQRRENVGAGGDDLLHLPAGAVAAAICRHGSGAQRPGLGMRDALYAAGAAAGHRGRRHRHGAGSAANQRFDSTPDFCRAAHPHRSAVGYLQRGLSVQLYHRAGDAVADPAGKRATGAAFP